MLCLDFGLVTHCGQLDRSVSSSPTQQGQDSHMGGTLVACPKQACGHRGQGWCTVPRTQGRQQQLSCEGRGPGTPLPPPAPGTPVFLANSSSISLQTQAHRGFRPSLCTVWNWFTCGSSLYFQNMARLGDAE